MKMRNLLKVCTLVVATAIAQSCVSDLGGPEYGSAATDINDDEVIVGSVTDDKFGEHAAVFEAGGPKRLPIPPDPLVLPPGGGGIISRPVAIANDRTIIGYYVTNARSVHTLLWDASGKVHDLYNVPGGPMGMPFAMNNRHVAVGSDFDGTRGGLWIYDVDSGRLTVPPPDPVNPLEQRIPNGINDRGDVVGVIGSLPILWRAGDYARVALPLPPGAKKGNARAINDAGTIVGSVDDRPVFWASATSQPTMLPVRTWERGQAVAINEAGVMTGYTEAGCSFECRFAAVAMEWTPDGKFREFEVAPRSPRDDAYAQGAAINSAGIIVGFRFVGSVQRATRFN